MEEQGEHNETLTECPETETESSESSSETDTTQVSRKSKSKRRSMQTRILSKLTKLMEQMSTLTKGTNKHRRHAGSNSSTEELTDNASVDSEVVLNFKHNDRTVPELTTFGTNLEPTQEPTSTQQIRTYSEPTQHEPTTREQIGTNSEPRQTYNREHNKTFSEPTQEPNGTQQDRTYFEPKQQHGFNTRPHIMPDKYDGSSDWKDYEIHFDSCRTINNWNNNEAVRYLSASLRGPALRLLNERKETTWTYCDLVSKLSLRFSSSKQAESYLQELRGLKRRPNESLRELGRIVRELTTKAYPGFDSDGIDRLAKIHFSDAIQNSEIRTGIFHAKAKTLDEMIEAAITTETFLMTESQRSWKKNTHNRVIELEQERLNQKELQKTVDLAVDRAVKQALTQQNVRTRTDERTRTNRANETRTYTCHYCQKPGHLERNCFKKQNDLKRQTQNCNQQRTWQTRHVDDLRQTNQSNDTGSPTRAMARPHRH